jgi:hypothetical protein
MRAEIRAGELLREVLKNKGAAPKNKAGRHLRRAAFS